MKYETSTPLCSIGVVHDRGEVFSIQMKDSHQANRTPECGMGWRAIRPLDELADLLTAFFALDFHLEGNFLESSMLVTEVIEIFAATIEPAAHLFFQRFDLQIKNAGGAAPLSEMAKAESR